MSSTNHVFHFRDKIFKITVAIGAEIIIFGGIAERTLQYKNFKYATSPSQCQHINLRIEKIIMAVDRILMRKEQLLACAKCTVSNCSNYAC